jgi:dipeptidyl aminopeptidase/acylaminoacyl peptidase
LRPADIGALVDVGDPRVSPDGRTVAYVVTTIDLDANEYRSRVWLAAADGSSAPRPLTAGEGRDARPRWSPDGRSLAFVSHRDEKGSEVYVIPVDGPGEVVQLAASPEEITEVKWSPDGKQLAFLARQRDEERYGQEKAKDQPPRRITRLYFRLDNVGWTVDRPTQLFAVPADGSAKPVAITSGPFQVGGLTWSPDGAVVAFSSARHDSWDLDLAVDLWRVRPDGASEPELLSDTSEQLALPSWSPEGSTIAYQWDEPLSYPRHGQIGVLDVATGARRLLTTALDRNCTPYVGGSREPIWDGTDLLFQVDDGGNVHLYRVPADGSGKPELVLGGERCINSVDMAGGTLAFAATTATALPELFVLDGGGERQLTRHGERFAAAVPAEAPERFTATSPDGAEVEAWMIRPAGFDATQRYPALLNVHGGPFTQYGNRFFDEFQVQAGAGYVVLYANPRGSSGYSEAWGRAIRGRTADVDPGSGWGGVDYDDVMAVVDAAVEQFPFIDSDRLGILGGSYGGFMTSWAVGHTDRFRAACSERAVNDVIALEYASDIATLFRGWLGASHLDDPDEYRRISPITYVRDITTPMLLLHSEDDLRCPIAQAEQLFVALRLLGQGVELVRFPGESHELSRSGAPRHRVQRLEIILEFFSSHMAPLA